MAAPESWLEDTPVQETEGAFDEQSPSKQSTGTEQDAAGLMDELFGSDDDDNNNNGNNNTDNKKILSKEWKRSVPEGKKVSISTNLDLSSLPQSSDFEFCILRLPNVIGCDSEEFDEKSYVEPSSCPYDNYMRWRTHYEEAMGETFKESNTKLVYWKDGTKSLFIGKDCYDIDEQELNYSFIYAKLENVTSNTSYKLCHGKFIKRLNVKATSQKSYKTLQKNLAKKHERTKGSKQLTAAQRRNNKANQQKKSQRGKKHKRKLNKKRSLKESWLEQGGHGDDSSDDNIRSKKRYKQSESDSSQLSDDDDDDDDDEDDDYNDSDSDEDDDDDDDLPIGNRL